MQNKCNYQIRAILKNVIIICEGENLNEKKICKISHHLSYSNDIFHVRFTYIG